MDDEEIDRAWREHKIRRRKARDRHFAQLSEREKKRVIANRIFSRIAFALWLSSLLGPILWIFLNTPE